MPTSAAFRKALDTYYVTLANVQAHGATNELATRQPFAALLETVARTHGWTLLMEQALPSGKRPDGTLCDGFNLPRGYWEAKDTDDDLNDEIRRKIKLGYPLTNLIFEDTRRAVLYQHGVVALEADLTDRAQLTGLLETFFAYTEPHIDDFNAAVAKFQDSIPALAKGLEQTIEDERKTNRKFIAAFATFQQLCQTAVDPNISADDIEKMLVQHLLTERLFRTIFANPDFVARNAIAQEIEKVIRALTSRTFSRAEFLKRLDHFYNAIENAAATIDDFTQKQAFLNTVYERFFQGYSRAQADTHGIVYTPQPIVDFMCASIEAILQREFGKSLSDEGVLLLDPCTGTGNFVVNLLRRVRRKDLPRKYARELFANELMLLPYYIASLNIEHAYYELAGEYAPFEGICFVDTLGLVKSAQLPLFGEENTERVKREQDATITVIMGNPPYNVGQRSENENNKNRRYLQDGEVDDRIRKTYAKDSQATNKNKLYDPYVKFFRWAMDRLEGRDGIVCFVSNNSFVDQLAFDGMRQHLARDFTAIYHLDLHGNVRKNPKLSGTTHNVFGIQVGVGITVLVRHRNKDLTGLHVSRLSGLIYYHRVPETWRKEEKLAFLTQTQSVEGIAWQTLAPDAKHTWLTAGMQSDFASFLPMGTKEAKASKTEPQTIFKMYGGGVKTNRDEWAYDFGRDALSEKMQSFIENYNGEVDRWARRRDKSKSVDDFVDNDETKIKWSLGLKIQLQRGHRAEYDERKIHAALYRPFCKRWLFFDRVTNEAVYQFPHIFPTPESETENAVIWLKVGSEVPMFALMTNVIPDLLPQGGSQCFPFYTYDEDGTNRRENITDWALAQFREHYGARPDRSGRPVRSIEKRDIFHYVYAMLHHPQYRERYAENLKRELPRIPYAPDLLGFQNLAGLGAQLAQLHLHYEQTQEYPLQWLENKDVPFSWRVTKMKLTPDKTAIVVNDSLTLAGIPPECFAYRLGNRSALEWVIDQYQVKDKNPRGFQNLAGLSGDPNRADDPAYIVRLSGRVVTVSVETVKLMNELTSVELIHA
jgi:predicted helicase